MTTCFICSDREAEYFAMIPGDFYAMNLCPVCYDALTDGIRFRNQSRVREAHALVCEHCNAKPAVSHVRFRYRSIDFYTEINAYNLCEDCQFAMWIGFEKEVIDYGPMEDES